MGFLKSFVDGKVDQIEIRRFESLQNDLREDVNQFKSAIKECREIHSSIVNEENRESISDWEELESLPQKLSDMEERINSPLIQSLTDPCSFQDQIIDCRIKQESWQRQIDTHGAFLEVLAISEVNIQREADREGDLRALTILFEGEEGLSRLASALGTVRELLLEVKTIQEDLDNTLRKLRNEPIGELKELDDMGERMSRLLQF